MDETNPQIKQQNEEEILQTQQAKGSVNSSVRSAWEAFIKAADDNLAPLVAVRDQDASEILKRASEAIATIAPIMTELQKRYSDKRDIIQSEIEEIDELAQLLLKLRLGLEALSRHNRLTQREKEKVTLLSETLTVQIKNVITSLNRLVNHQPQALLNKKLAYIVDQLTAPETLEVRLRSSSKLKEQIKGIHLQSDLTKAIGSIQNILQLVLGDSSLPIQSDIDQSISEIRTIVSNVEGKYFGSLKEGIDTLHILHQHKCKIMRGTSEVEKMEALRNDLDGLIEANKSRKEQQKLIKEKTDKSLLGRLAIFKSSTSSSIKYSKLEPDILEKCEALFSQLKNKLNNFEKTINESRKDIEKLTEITKDSAWLTSKLASQNYNLNSALKKEGRPEIQSARELLSEPQADGSQVNPSNIDYAEIDDYEEQDPLDSLTYDAEIADSKSEDLTPPRRLNFSTAFGLAQIRGFSSHTGEVLTAPSYYDDLYDAPLDQKREASVEALSETPPTSHIVASTFTGFAGESIYDLPLASVSGINEEENTRPATPPEVKTHELPLSARAAMDDEEAKQITATDNNSANKLVEPTIRTDNRLNLLPPEIFAQVLTDVSEQLAPAQALHRLLTLGSDNPHLQNALHIAFPDIEAMKASLEVALPNLAANDQLTHIRDEALEDIKEQDFDSYLKAALTKITALAYAVIYSKNNNDTRRQEGLINKIMENCKHQGINLDDIHDKNSALPLLSSLLANKKGIKTVVIKCDFPNARLRAKIIDVCRALTKDNAQITITLQSTREALGEIKEQIQNQNINYQETRITTVMSELASHQISSLTSQTQHIDVLPNHNPLAHTHREQLSSQPSAVGLHSQSNPRGR